MKGVILVAGTDTKLLPATKTNHKHLLPVYDRPLAFYAVNTLKDSGVRDILVIASSENVGAVSKALGSGKDFGVHFTYKIQDGNGGNAQALALAEEFVGDDTVAVIAGDNVFEDEFSEPALSFKSGAQIFIKTVEDPERFGVVEMNEDFSIRSIEEKPSFPKSEMVQTGLTFYDSEVFDLIRTLEPSKRGTLDLTDVNIKYLEQNKLQVFKVSGMWMDVSSPESLLEASILSHESFEGNGGVIRTKKSQSLASTTPKVTVGLVLYNAASYLKPCLQSLHEQDYADLEIVLLDNGSTDDTVKIVQEQFPDFELIIAEENLGFGKAHNRILQETEGDFYACLNFDMIFEPQFISQLVRSMQLEPKLGSVGGKIKRWDFAGYQENSGAVREMGKTNFIDSIGIRILKSHRFEDIGQGEVDYGQFDDVQQIFGVSGAAALYRRSALEDVAFAGEEGGREYFDESMFIYKEDVDLAYRLQWAGWKSQFVPEASCYHDRTIAFRESENTIWKWIKNRRNKPARINRASYLNHHILLSKNFSPKFSRGVRRATFFYNLKIFFYLLLCEQETLLTWGKYWKLKKKIKEKRSTMPRRVNQKIIEELMLS